MDTLTTQRLFGWREVLDDHLTLTLAGGIVGALLLAGAVTLALGAAGKLSPTMGDELRARLLTWAVLIAAMLLPLLLGAAWVMAGMLILSLVCYREYARATGLFRHPGMSALVVVGILAINFAVVDHWYGFFAALPALGMISLAGLSILRDEPKGYIQRVALGALAFLFFGVCLGHMSYLGNDAGFRHLLLLLVVSVELNDVFAFVCGKSFGRRKAFPKTSPNKTLGGSLGALMCTTILVTLLGRLIFEGTPMHAWPCLLGLGIITSLAGQLGDLVMSSIKRDLGIKDMGRALPGHGGFLDRFDSLILVAPAFFHYVGYFNGIGLDQPVRILTGS